MPETHGLSNDKSYFYAKFHQHRSSHKKKSKLNLWLSFCPKGVNKNSFLTPFSCIHSGLHNTWYKLIPNRSIRFISSSAEARTGRQTHTSTEYRNTDRNVFTHRFWTQGTPKKILTLHTHNQILHHHSTSSMQ